MTHLITINELLLRYQPEPAQLVWRMLVCTLDSPAAAQVKSYAVHLSELLRVCPGDYEIFKKNSFDELIEEVGRGYDLVVFGEPQSPRLKQWFFGPPGCQAVERLPASVVVARQPRWPLKHLLLVTRGLERDNVAVTWLGYLSRYSPAQITVLALLPPMSSSDVHALYRNGLADWLDSDTPLGRQLRHIADWGRDPELRFQAGPPNWQIRQTVAEAQPDLIVIAADPAEWYIRRLLGEVVGPLLDWVDRPVFVAKPAGMQTQ